MKIAGIIVRTLMGLLFVFAASAYLFKLFPEPQLEGNIKIFMDGLNASGFMMTLVKVTELVCGLAFLTGRFVPLACVVIAPVIVNILFVNISLDRTGLPIGIFLVLANSFLAYIHWEKFKPILSAK